MAGAFVSEVISSSTCLAISSLSARNFLVRSCSRSSISTVVSRFGSNFTTACFEYRSSKSRQLGSSARPILDETHHHVTQSKSRNSMFLEQVLETRSDRAPGGGHFQNLNYHQLGINIIPSAQSKKNLRTAKTSLNFHQLGLNAITSAQSE